MAQLTVVRFIDDIDGSDLADAETPTLTFALDGTQYEIDLSDKSQEKLRKALAPYIGAGRRVSGSRGKAPRGRKSAAAATGATAADVRAWAVEQGLDVPARGRVPQEVRDAFEAAN